MRRRLAFGVLWVALALSMAAGCSDLSPPQQRALSGGVIGTTAGAALSAPSIRGRRDGSVPR
jgi:hypothetical protein